MHAALVGVCRLGLYRPSYAMTIPFSRDLAFEYGVAHRVAPKIRRIVAKNPSPFTLYGTGTYIIGEGKVAVIDPRTSCCLAWSARLSSVGREISGKFAKKPGNYWKPLD